MKLPSVFRYVLVAIAVAGALFAFWLARAAALFQQDTAVSVPAAAHMVPFDSQYLARLAAWQPRDKEPMLERALALNPFDAPSWIQLGFLREFRAHDAVSAERYYLKAAAVDRMFLPRWTLTNFYFRHGNADAFFRWARATLAITPYPPDPVFIQMWLMTQDATRIAAVLPDRPRILLPYAWFLSNTNQTSTIARVVERLVQSAGNRDAGRPWGRDDLLAAIEDRLVFGNERGSALAVWGSLVRAGWLPYTIPDERQPLVNGDFRTPLYRHGFDWIPSAVDGAAVDHFPSEGSLRLEFSGNEPERCSLLAHYLPLAPDRDYVLRWQADARLLEAPSGLHWHLKPAVGATAANVLVSPDAAASPFSWRFHSPSAAGLSLLTLEYARPLGHLRAKGSLTLRWVSLAPAQ